MRRGLWAGPAASFAQGFCVGPFEFRLPGYGPAVVGVAPDPSWRDRYARAKFIIEQVKQSPIARAVMYAYAAYKLYTYGELPGTAGRVQTVEELYREYVDDFVPFRTPPLLPSKERVKRFIDFLLETTDVTDANALAGLVANFPPQWLVDP